MLQKAKKILKRTRLHKPVKKGFLFLKNLGGKKSADLIKAGGWVNIPRNVVFEPTIKCNLNCRMCYQKKERESGAMDLPLGEIKKIFERLKTQNNINHVSLIGAEVFMRPDIYEIIGFLDELGIGVFIQSNFTLITEKSAEQLKKFRNIRGIGTSLDGERDLHNQIRGRQDAFDRVFKAAELLKKDFTVTINTVVMDDNIGQILNIANLVKSAGIDDYSLQFEMAATKEEVEESARILGIGEPCFGVEAKDNNRFSFGAEEVVGVLEKLKQIKGLNVAVQPGVFNKHPEFYLDGTLRENAGLRCKDINAIRINAQGEVVFCPFIKKSFGSLLEKDLSGIWNSDEFREFRMRLLKNNLAPVCKRCCRLGLA